NLAFRVGGRSERLAVVEIGPAIPLAVPAILLDVLAQVSNLGQAFISEGKVATLAGHRHKPIEHVVKEEAKPHAFAPPVFTHQVHSVVPIAATNQGQPMCTVFPAMTNGPDTMFVKRKRLARGPMSVVIAFLLRSHRASFQKW